MDDLISRQAAIDAIKSYWKNEVDRIPKKSTDFDVFTQICDSILSHNANICKAIDKLPSAQPEQRWIPCEERVPEEPFGCLVTVMDTEPMTGEDFENLYPYFVGWDGEQWNDCDGCQCPFEVLAWMPLPEPYKMDEVEE